MLPIEPWKIFPHRYRPVQDIARDFKLTVQDVDIVIQYIYDNFEEVEEEYNELTK
jgi:hypothetical protein